jgi:hypothetical protein
VADKKESKIIIVFIKLDLPSLQKGYQEAQVIVISHDRQCRHDDSQEQETEWVR